MRQQLHRTTTDRVAGRPALRLQPPDHDPRRPDGEARRAARINRRASSSTNIAATSSTRTGSSASATKTRRGWQALFERCREQGRGDRAARWPRSASTSASTSRVPPHRQPGAEGRERGAAGQEGDGRGQPAPGHLDRQEIHQPRPAVPGSDPGRQHRPDEGGRQIRVSPRLQVLDLRDLVDPPGDHPLDRRPGADHPHPGPHDRDDQQAGPHRAPDAARDRPRADARGAGREAVRCRSRRSAR